MSVFSFVFFGLVLSVEEDKYRQCEQSRFCLRNREVSKQHWKLIPRSIEFKPESFRVLIQDDQNDKQLFMSVFFLQTGVRYRIEPTEAESFHRYDCSKERTVVAFSEVNQTKKYSNSQNATHIFLRYMDTQVTIQQSPFQSTITTKRGRIVTINPDDTAVFEHNRDRNRNPRLFDANDFNGVVDKVPNGPTSVAMDFLWHGNAVRLSGLPEHTLNLTLPYTTHRLRRRGQLEYQPITDPIRLFNVDVHKYEIGNVMAMYGAIPFVLSRDTINSAGLLWCNPSETWVDTSEERGGAMTRFLSEGGYIDFFVFLGPTPSDVINQYTKLTGRPQLVQGFALGYHQSRWGYKTTNEVRDITKQLDESIIPHDAIWLDLDHTDDKLYFTFHPHNFKDVVQFQDEIDPMERKVVALSDPHLRLDYGYPLFERAFNNRYLVRTRIDSEYSAQCWPGDSVWVDFLSPWARIWWETLYEFENYKGSTLSLYVWNDMNEPAVFDQPDNTIPKDTVHYHGYENREVHNVYGHLMISATFGGLVKRVDDGDDRPFVLTRSFFAGSQKYAVTWTGDNTANWVQLRGSLPMILSLGLAGMPFSGADVGGFFDSPNPTLLVRWFQLGAWCYPFFREHCHHDSEKREPNTLKGGYLEGARKAIYERYQMFPVWYTLARHTNLTGEPIIRPLWWEFPKDRRFADTEDRVMLGPHVLILPVFNELDNERRVELPFCRWFDYRTLNEKTCKEGMISLDAPITHIPVLIRGGSILPIKMWKRRTTHLQFRDPFQLIVCLDEESHSSGDLYIDDEMTFAFAKGNYIHRRFTYSDRVLSSRPYNNEQVRGEFYDDYDARIEKIRIAGLSQQPSLVRTQEGSVFNTEWTNGILTIHRANLSVKENWVVMFEFEGTAPPEINETTTSVQKEIEEPELIEELVEENPLDEQDNTRENEL